MSDPVLNPSRSSTILTPDWFARPSPEVAPELLGTVLVRQFANGDRLRGRIVETEAYAPGDPACHAYKRQTNRNRSMFGPAGQVYVYLIYGVYHCLNIVTDAEGVGSAVLLRALDLESIPAWIPEKKRKRPERVAAGPGLLCQAIQVDRRQDGWSLHPKTGDALWLEKGQAVETDSIVQTTRVGLTKGRDTPWRWYLAGCKAVSKL